MLEQKTVRALNSSSSIVSLVKLLEVVRPDEFGDALPRDGARLMHVHRGNDRGPAAIPV